MSTMLRRNFIIIIIFSYINFQSIDMNIYNNLNTINNTIINSFMVPVVLIENNTAVRNINIKTDIGNFSKIQVPLPSKSTVNKLIPNENDAFNILNMNELVKNLSLSLKNIRNDELGVTIIQEIFDSIDFTTIPSNDTETVKKLANRMTIKLNKAFDIIEKLKIYIKNITTTINTESTFYLNTVIRPCPFEDFNLKQNYNKNQIEIFNYLKRNEYHEKHDMNFTADAKLKDELKRLNSEENNNFKHIFYLSKYDHATDHNCLYYFNDINFRHFYVSTIKNKYVFLLIDNGKSFNLQQFDLSKIFASNIINMLSDNDYISITTVSDRAKGKQLKYMNNNSFVFHSTMEIREEMLKFINEINTSNEQTNHSVGFEYVFDIIKQQNITNDKPVLFLYITRGLLTRFNDTTSVLQTISKGQKLLKVPIIINTCAVIIDEKRVMYEKQFLTDIAQQNYKKFDIDVTDWYNTSINLKGNMFVITKGHPELIIKTSCASFERFFEEKYLIKGIKHSLPRLDYNTKDFLISITENIGSHGIVGINMYLSDLIEDIIYYKKSEGSYAFLINKYGITISHPSFSRPIATNKNNYPVDIGYLEKATNFSIIRNQMLKKITGTLSSSIENTNMSIKYTWHHVSEIYIICIVTKNLNGKLNMPLISNIYGKQHHHQFNQHFSAKELLYHRIDLIPPQTPLCRHFRQIATLDTGTIFLSASSFQSPFIYMINNQDNKNEKLVQNTQSIMAYIKDVTNLLANPGLLPQIKNDVTALYHVMSYLKRRHQEGGPLKKYIIRRYATTTNGVLQIYPGCVLGTNLEPSQRPWYKKAIENSGKIIATEPYLDAGGAGYIVTIAHTIFEGKPNALHNSEQDLPIAVIAIDVPYAFFYKMLLESGTLCSEINIKCILIEDQGYLIAHPSFLQPSTGIMNNRRPLEHITHKELFVANDFLNHKTLVKKNICANYSNRTLQRYYKFNTSLNEILTNVVSGDRTKYQITVIKGTNIFAIVLNSTCNGGAFCPCSTIDRTCLNCNRMDQTDCECPCECKLNLPDGFNRNSSFKYDYCEPPNEDLSVVNSLSYDWNMVLKTCFNINCDLYLTQLDCLGIMGCEWCQLDADGNILNTPFCTTQNSCFNGMLGSMTPYGDGYLGSAIIEQTTQPAYSAIGPVGGAIFALCLIVGFAIYCYRQNLDNSSEQLYGGSFQEENYGLPLSRFNFDDINKPQDDININRIGNGINSNRNLLNSIANTIVVPDISPYHMSSIGCRKPNGESDHGYSTMTPHEDSEHMCFTLVEPLINNKRLSTSDSMSIGTSVSSPTNHNYGLNIDNSVCQLKNVVDISQQTVLPETILPQHHILAPVTVHRHMEAS